MLQSFFMETACIYLLCRGKQKTICSIFILRNANGLRKTRMFLQRNSHTLIIKMERIFDFSSRYSTNVFFSNSYFTLSIVPGISLIFVYIPQLWYLTHWHLRLPVPWESLFKGHDSNISKYCKTIQNTAINFCEFCKNTITFSWIWTQSVLPIFLWVVEHAARVVSVSCIELLSWWWKHIICLFEKEDVAWQKLIQKSQCHSIVKL